MLSPVFAVSTGPPTGSAQIASMPMTSNMADGINNIENVNTNTNPSFNQVTSTPSDSNVPITSGADSNNQSPVADSNNQSPVADSNNQFPHPNNVKLDGGTLTVNNQPLENSTSLNSFITPNTNNIKTDGGTLTHNT